MADATPTVVAQAAEMFARDLATAAAALATQRKSNVLTVADLHAAAHGDEMFDFVRECLDASLAATDDKAPQHKAASAAADADP